LKLRSIPIQSQTRSRTSASSPVGFTLKPAPLSERGPKPCRWRGRCRLAPRTQPSRPSLVSERSETTAHHRRRARRRLACGCRGARASTPHESRLGPRAAPPCAFRAWGRHGAGIGPLPIRKEGGLAARSPRGADPPRLARGGSGRGRSWRLEEERGVGAMGRTFF
jgi:hypothetical protein